MRVIEKIVDSKPKVQLLDLILERDAEFSVSGLSRLSNIPKATVSRIVSDWENVGLVSCRGEGRNKMVGINRKFPILSQLKRMFSEAKQFQRPFISLLRNSKPFRKKGVKAVILFGSRARDDFTSNSDLDVLFIVDNKDTLEVQIMSELSNLSEEAGLRFSPTVLSQPDFRSRIKRGDKLVSNILAEGNILKGADFVGKLQRTY